MKRIALPITSFGILNTVFKKLYLINNDQPIEPFKSNKKVSHQTNIWYKRFTNLKFSYKEYSLHT